MSTGTRIVNYDNWEFAYFQHLLNMRDIFATKLSLTNPEIKKYLYSPQFFYIFCRFIYDMSSKYVSKHLTEIEENDFFEYLIKRDNE